MPKHKNAAGEPPRPSVHFDSISADHIQTHCIELLDNQGQLRGCLAVEPVSGIASLVLCNERPNVAGTVSVGINEVGLPYVTMNDRQTRRRFLLTLDEAGRPICELRDEKEVPVLTMRIEEERRPMLVYSTADGAARVISILHATGIPGVVLVGPSGRLLGKLALDANHRLGWHWLVPENELDFGPVPDGPPPKPPTPMPSLPTSPTPTPSSPPTDCA